MTMSTAETKMALALADAVDVTSAKAYYKTTWPIEVHAGLRNISEDTRRTLQNQADEDASNYALDF